jgi:PLD-like domain
MSSTTFLTNEALWQTISDRIKDANRVDAAIAYFGQDGARLLRLRKGHRLVVDMSPAMVKAGATDPSEVEKLIGRGVEVFTRSCLHAKVVVADKVLIAGSANVSRRSQSVLDEAAIQTTDEAAVRRAREFIERICTEPVRPEYLQECKRLYRAPKFAGAPGGAQGKGQRAVHAKLWMVNIGEAKIPESEIERYEVGEETARGLVKDNERSRVESFHWSLKPRMADELELGDWIIQEMTWDDNSVTVHAPGQLLHVDHYVRDSASGKERWVFHLEVPRRGESLSWAQFRRGAKTLLGPKALAAPRMRPVRDIATADGLLSLWTPSGRVSVR